MKKNTSIALVLIGLIAVLIIGGFLFMQMNKSNVPTSNSKTSGNSQANVLSINKITTGQTYNIEIKNFAFSPSSLTIKKGDSVSWTSRLLLNLSK